jgi:recombination protein RecA
MSNRKRRQLDSIIATLQTRYGPQVVRKAGELKATKPPALSSGFAALDACTGCQGIPLGHITLLSGRITSGKLTLAHAKTAAILDFNQHSDPDYLARCGVDLSKLVVVRPAADQAAVNLLVDIVRSRQAQLILVDSITNLLAAERAVAGHLYRALDVLPQALRQAKCALLLIDEADLR